MVYGLGHLSIVVRQGGSVGKSGLEPGRILLLDLDLFEVVDEGSFGWYCRGRCSVVAIVVAFDHLELLLVLVRP